METTDESLGKRKREEEEPTDKKKHTQENKSNNKDQQKKERKKFVYGNYNSYYGYRITDGGMDPRLSLFKREWFQGKRCLDIGCNTGQLTLSVGKEFEPRYLLGIDIDPKLIGQAKKAVTTLIYARKNIAKAGVQKSGAVLPAGSITNTSTSTTAATATPAAISTITSPITSASPTTSLTTATTTSITLATTPRCFPISFGATANASSKKQEFPDNVFFATENFVKAEHTAKYDVVMCLSVSKWIHMNWGDEGIKQTFKKVYDSLYQGGMFIFEPQEWKSYKKKASLTPAIHDTYRSIQFKPDQFRDYLLKEIGFKSCEELGAPKGVVSGGFNRGVYVYIK